MPPHGAHQHQKWPNMALWVGGYAPFLQPSECISTNNWQQERYNSAPTWCRFGGFSDNAQIPTIFTLVPWKHHVKLFKLFTKKFKPTYFISSSAILINILASFDPLHRSRCPHRSLFESRNLLKILINLALEKSLNNFCGNNFKMWVYPGSDILY